MELSTLEHSLRCSVCLDTFKEPKVLPCCHTFCKACLERILNPETSTEYGTTEELLVKRQKRAKSEESLTCPQCRIHVDLPDGGVDAFLTDFAIQTELKKEASAQLEKDNQKQCSLCESSSDPAINYCDDCSYLLCDVCSKAHERQKQYRQHIVKSLDEVDSSLLATKAQSQTHQLTCLKHPNQTPQIYCKSCDVLVCCECIIEGHEGHKFGGINTKTRSEVEEKLSVTSSAVRELFQTFRENHEYVASVEKVTSDVTTKMKADINETFDSFITVLNQRRDELLTNLEENCDAKLKSLWSEKEGLEKTIAKFTTTLGFMERSLKCNYDGEFLSLVSQVLLRLKELEHSCWESTTVAEIESSYLHFEKVLQPSVFQSACGLEEVKNSLCVMQWKEFPKQVSLGAEHKGVVCITRDNGYRPAILDCKPSIVIRHASSATCNVADVNITQSTTLPGAWDVTFTPYCGGPHTCKVSVESAGSLSTSFDVTGVPAAGSRVMRGPSWNYINTHTYGKDKSDFGIVDNCNHLQDEKKITIVWQDGKKFAYHWDDDGLYGIQLLH